jgi:hypothetical protein
MVRTCPRCGAQTDDAGHVCQQCGTPLQAPPPAQPTAPGPTPAVAPGTAGPGGTPRQPGGAAPAGSRRPGALGPRLSWLQPRTLAVGLVGIVVLAGALLARAMGSGPPTVPVPPMPTPTAIMPATGTSTAQPATSATPALVVPVASQTPAPAGPAPPASSPNPQSSTAIEAALVGSWLGPGLGDTGRCGAEYGQFTFFQNQDYSYTENTDYIQPTAIPSMTPGTGSSCGGITNAGTYWIANSVLYLHWTTCNFPCQPGTASAAFRFIDSADFQLQDGARTEIYHRQ